MRGQVYAAWSQIQLFVFLAVMAYPPARAGSSRVVVPMDQAALLVPDIVAKELDGISDRDVSHSWSKVDVVLYQDGLTRIQPKNKPLMP